MIARAAAWAATLLGAVLIVSTYHVFSQTYDEPAHIAAGMQWLSEGRYQYEPQHPPMGRVAAAIGPYLAGDRSLHEQSMYYEGQRLLGVGAHYRRTLELARLGELPFFLLLCLVTWLWGKRLFGDRGAIGGALGVWFVATNPNILAHSALATTDIAPTLMVITALYAYARWVARPTLGESVLFGTCLGLAAVSKFSAIAFLGPTIVLAEIWAQVCLRRGTVARRPRMRTMLLLAAVVILECAGVIWAVYRFSTGRIGTTTIVGPAPAFFEGLATFLAHDAGGHPAFLLGQTSDTGWWYYFPVALLVKTPLPLIALAALGTWTTARAMWRDRVFEPALPLIGAAVVLIIGMTAKVDIGIRHLLPMYPLVALLGARGALDLWNQASQPRIARSVTAALVACSVFIVLRAEPDQLAYFNPLAGPHPERVLVDSNLDWGQDLYRLADVEQRLHIDTLHVAYFGTANLRAAGLTHASRLLPDQRATGWVAASQTLLQGEWVGGAYGWLFNYPAVGRVGKSMVLFRVGR